MQGGTVESALVVAAPHELTKGWSYTALSRARGTTRLFVITDQERKAREEMAPGERGASANEHDLYERMARYMRTRDDEDLAIEQLPASPAHAVERPMAIAGSVLEEAAAQSAEPMSQEPASRAAFERISPAIEAIEAQLRSLNSSDVARLAAAERRERELIAHRDELLTRTQQTESTPSKREDQRSEA
jgi:hypothetical protein